MSLIILGGHYGVGKTTLALNMAREAGRLGKNVSLIDLDLVNPYYRSGDYAAWCKDWGIELIAPSFSGTTLDTPSISASVLSHALQSQEDSRKMAIVDLGGSDVGARVWGSIQSRINHSCCATLYVVNLMRDSCTSAEEICEDIQEIEAASRTTFSFLVNNSHMCNETSLEMLKTCDAKAQEIARRLGKIFIGSTMVHSLAQLDDSLPCRKKGLKELFCKINLASLQVDEEKNSCKSVSDYSLSRQICLNEEGSFWIVEPLVVHPWSL